MTSKKAVQRLNNVLDLSEAWFQKYGESDPEAHLLLKNLLKNSIKGVKKIDYRVNYDDQVVEIILYMGSWRLFFSRTQKIANNVVMLLENCLSDYEITVRVMRYKEES